MIRRKIKEIKEKLKNQKFSTSLPVKWFKVKCGTFWYRTGNKLTKPIDQSFVIISLNLLELKEQVCNVCRSHSRKTKNKVLKFLNHFLKWLWSFQIFRRNNFWPADATIPLSNMSKEVVGIPSRIGTCLSFFWDNKSHSITLPVSQAAYIFDVVMKHSGRYSVTNQVFKIFRQIIPTQELTK